MLDGEVDDRPTALRKGMPLQPETPRDSTTVLESTSRFMEYLGNEESTEDPVIPPETMRKLVRRSVTQKQLLRVLPQTIEVESMQSRQLDRKGEGTVEVTVTERVGNTTIQRAFTVPGRMIETTDNRLIWKSDRTLLRNDKPDLLENIQFNRETSRSKRMSKQPGDKRELPAIMETPVNPLHIKLR